MIKTMFNIFRNSKKRIEEDIQKCINVYSTSADSKTSLIIWIEDQILYQIEHPSHYTKHFVNKLCKDKLVEVHFFNKSKTLTNYAEQYFIEKDNQNQYIHFEESKGNNIYIRKIENTEILESIHNCLNDIYKIDLDKLRIEIVKSK